MANKDTSKQWFNTGDYPTEAQFAQVFEWLRWKDEALATGDVTGLDMALQQLQTNITNASGAPTAVTIPANGTMEVGLPLGKLTDNFVLLSPTSQTVTIQPRNLPEQADAIVCEVHANVPYLIGFGVYVAATNITAAVEVTVINAITFLIYKR
jgi:hypothetical protein